MKLEELQLALLDMTQEQKLAHVRSIREDIRVSKYAITHKARQKKDKADKIADQFEQLSLEDQAALLELMRGGNED